MKVFFFFSLKKECLCPFKWVQQVLIHATVRLAHIISLLFSYNKFKMDSYGALFLFIADPER